MTKEQNNMILEDFLLDEDIEYRKEENGFYVETYMDKTKLPHALIHITSNEQMIYFSIYPAQYIIPIEKISDVAQYFRLINGFSIWGSFELANEQIAIMDIDIPNAGIFPSYKICCDTIDNVPSKDRIQFIIAILLSSYEKYIDGVLMIEHDILTPLQAARAFLEKE